MKLIRNIWSYVAYVVSLDRLLMLSIFIDFAILVYSAVDYRSVIGSGNMIVMVVAILINFCWQLYNLINHFHFLKMVNPAEQTTSNLSDRKSKRIDYSRFIVRDLDNYERDNELGVLVPANVNKILQDKNVNIKSKLVKQKRVNTIRYIKHYKQTLLVFLNHKWHDVNDKHGQFDNEKKLCLASELDESTYVWRVCEGCYYNSYITNSIFNKHIAGSKYPTYPPFNSLNSAILPLYESFFSDHIGISTLIVTDDYYTILFEQAYNAGQSPGEKMPSGSGSMDYKDYKAGEDFRQSIIRATERELGEETRMDFLKNETDGEIVLSTEVIGFYRDMERGGKPEFCCLTFIRMNHTSLTEVTDPNKNELSDGVKKVCRLLDNDEEWSDIILPEASLSLKMNYRFAKDYFERRPSARRQEGE